MKNKSGSQSSQRNLTAPSHTNQLAGRQPPHNISRDWGLLVPDQMILELVYGTRFDRIPTLAARFLAIQDAIKNDEREAIRAIARESSARRFRDVIRAIEFGLDGGDSWRANHTARAVVREAFSSSPQYFAALDRFTASLREIRKIG